MTKPILTSFSGLAPLYGQKYTRYLPSAFNENMTILEKVNKMIQYMNQIGEITDGVVDQWNTVMDWVQNEGLNDSVFAKIDDLIAKGTFSTLLNGMFTDINTAVTAFETTVNGQITNINNALTDNTYFKNNLIVNVLMFGADNTGTRLTATDIKSALDFIKAHNGGTLIIPDGDYLIDFKLRLPANSRLIFGKNARFIRAYAGGFFDNGDYANLTGNSNIEIDGGIFDGNYLGLTQYPATTADMIFLGYSENIIIRNATFKDVLSYHAIDCNGITNLLIENCQFVGYSNVVNTDVPRESIQIAEAQVFEDGTDNYQPCQNVTVRDCYFGPSENCGSPTVAVGNHYSRFNIYCNNITIENNRLEGCTLYGIRPFKWAKVKILNNVINKCPVGIQISNSDANTESSKYVNGTQSGMPQAGYDYHIEGNMIYDYDNEGIYSSGQENNGTVAKTKNVRIINNSFRSSGATNPDNNPLHFNLCEDLDILHNYFENTKRALLISGCKFVTFSHNFARNLSAEFVCSLASSVTTVGADGYYTENLTISDNEVHEAQNNGFYLLRMRHLLVESNRNYYVAQNTDGTDRGGLYCDDVQYAEIRSNYTIGGNVKFNVNIQATCDSIHTFNNYGDGKIYLSGTNCDDGFYSMDATNNIVFKSQKA